MGEKWKKRCNNQNKCDREWRLQHQKTGFAKILFLITVKAMQYLSFNKIIVFTKLFMLFTSCDKFVEKCGKLHNMCVYIYKYSVYKFIKYCLRKQRILVKISIISLAHIGQMHHKI